MIKNDRQYRLTKTQVRSFQSAINDLDVQPAPPGTDPALAVIQKRALESQLDELNAEASEYEALKSGRITAFEANSLDELPIMLVKARIARGMMHKDLAAQLKVKEQQIQRWESNDFAGVSLENLKAVADALGVVLVQRVFVPNASLTPDNFLNSLNCLGLSRDFILGKLLAPELAASLASDEAGLKDVVKAASAIARVFSLGIRDLVELKAPQLDLSWVAATRFKLAAKARKTAISGYAIYAHYLATVVASCANMEKRKPFPADYRKFLEAVSQPGKPMTFENVIRFLWDCGIIVLPLRDSGLFHGAVWKIGETFVIALKQKTMLQSRWLYDSLHECGHIRNGDVTGEAAFLEVQEISPKAKSNEEAAANEWAEGAIFNGRAFEMEKACVAACHGRLEKLKAVLPSIAKEFNVNLGSLANLMAFRLAEQGHNWWGPAHNLQANDRNPFEIARNVLLEHVNLSCSSPFDRELLQRALNNE